MIDWTFVWSWVTARLTENVVDLVIRDGARALGEAGIHHQTDEKE